MSDTKVAKPSTNSGAGKDVAKTLNDLVLHLGEGAVKVVFEKVDKSTRTGVFTANAKMIADSGYVAPPPKPGAAPRKPAVGVVSVFELSTKSWKSFRTASLISWERQ